MKTKQKGEIKLVESKSFLKLREVSIRAINKTRVQGTT